MSTRPKRKVVIKSKTPVPPPPRKWRDYEMEILLKSIMEFGHKDLNRISERLPGRNLQNIKTFIRTIYDTAGKLQKQKNGFNVWIDKSEKLEGTPWRDCLQIAQVMKYLSVDGLLENHPLPERCQGIDFRQAYRLIYQALMGYPIQPVNKPTADFILETLAELSGEIKKQTSTIKKVESFLSSESKNEGSSVSITPEMPNDNLNETTGKKPLKVYQRKKSVLSNVEMKPCMKISVEEIPGDSGSGCSKNFSVAVESSEGSVLRTVNVPVPYQEEVDESEQNLLKSTSYNPFQIPNKWLKEPLYINLL